MPFTERELRAMLEDNSADVPPTHDLAATAEAGGRRARRRRYVAGGLATAAALAVGFTVIPGLFAADDDPRGEDRGPLLAATVSPAVSQRPDVDLSVLKDDKDLLPNGSSTAVSLTPFQNWSSPEARKRQAVLEKNGKLLRLAYLSSHVVSGTVTGFAPVDSPSLISWADPSGARPGRPLPSGAKNPLPEGTTFVGLTLHVDRELASAGGLKKSSAGDVTVVLGPAPVAAVDRLKAALPSGVRTVAFLNGPAGEDPLLYSADNLVFEDADGSLTGGTFTLPATVPDPDASSPAPVTAPKTFDDLLKVLADSEQACAAGYAAQGNKRLSPKELQAIGKDNRLRCLRLRFPSGSPADPTPVPTAPPTVSPSAPDAAPPTVSPSPS
ncbi:hypothetical protein [Actinocorallia longicatena]|uniref:Uncharacterized protein n=1 Tax=Actinocorallia longicatena TaxID=111803 RepID=A0ABP6Q0Z8_9ACTN